MRKVKIVFLVPAFLAAWFAVSNIMTADAADSSFEETILSRLQGILPEGVTKIIHSKDLPVPELHPLPLYHNSDTLQVYWKPILDTAGYDSCYYFVKCDRTDEAGELVTIDWSVVVDSTGFENLDTSTVFYNLPEDTLYFALLAWARRDTSLYISDTSEICSTIIDVTPPLLDSLHTYSLEGENPDWTISRDVKVRYWGRDDPYELCGYIDISVNMILSRIVRYPVSDCVGEVVFGLSRHSEDKIVCGRLVDLAGNIGDSVRCDTIFLLEQAHSYPNPFNPAEGEAANLVFYSPAESAVKIKVYDLTGNLVYHGAAVPQVGRNDGGTRSEFRWNGRNDKNEIVANGGYICILEQNDNELGRIKIAVLK
ncbi:MAG: hypothetical protein JSU69_11455 [Candidatus Zixiibacteriota bacterium]|nr:MAG: hypothetical protein JSU69_11455 [candidate division Zixibacteria bacterium]